MLAYADPEVLLARPREAMTDRERAAKDALDLAVAKANTEIDKINSDPAISPDDKRKLIAQINSAKATGNIDIINSAVSHVDAQKSEAVATASYEYLGNASVAQSYVLSAAANARIESRAHYWNIDNSTQLRAYTNAIIDEQDPAFKAYRAEQLAQEIEHDPALKAATRTFTEAPKAVQVAVLKREETTTALIQDALHKAPAGSPLRATLTEAQRYAKSDAMHTAMLSGDPAKIEAATHAQHQEFVAEGDRLLGQRERSADGHVRHRAQMVRQMGGTAGAMMIADGLSTAAEAQAKKDVATGNVDKLPPDSVRAKAAAAVEQVALTQDYYNTFQRAATVAIVKQLGKGADIAVDTYDRATHEQKVAQMTTMLMANTQSASLLNSLDAKGKTAIVEQFVDQIDTNSLHYSKVSALNTSLSGMIVREAAKENGVHLDGKSKASVGMLLMSQGADAIVKGNTEAATFWAGQVEKGLAHNGVNQTLAHVVGSSLKIGGVVGTGAVHAMGTASNMAVAAKDATVHALVHPVDTATSVGTSIYNAGAAAKHALMNPGETAHNITTSVSSTATSWYNWATGTKPAPAPAKPAVSPQQAEINRVRAAVDTDHNGSLSAAEINTYLAARGTTAAQADKDHKGLSNGDLVAASHLPVKAPAAHAGNGIQQNNAAFVAAERKLGLDPTVAHSAKEIAAAMKSHGVKDADIAKFAQGGFQVGEVVAAAQHLPPAKPTPAAKGAHH